MSRLVLTLEAIDDLERVRSFLAEKSIEAAERAKTVIIEHLEKVQRFPTIYRPVPTQRDRREIVIAFGSYGYVARYQYDQEADTVTILSVWHQRENRQ
jgi:plasmid stabilization system protein ParE